MPVDIIAQKEPEDGFPSEFFGSVFGRRRDRPARVRSGRLETPTGLYGTAMTGKVWAGD
jgi:hypothetical protein